VRFWISAQVLVTRGMVAGLGNHHAPGRELNGAQYMGGY